jgi:hypothetical protein
MKYIGMCQYQHGEPILMITSTIGADDSSIKEIGTSIPAWLLLANQKMMVSSAIYTDDSTMKDIGMTIPA